MGTGHSVPISDSSRKDIVQVVSKLLTKTHLRLPPSHWEPPESTMPANGKPNGRFELPALTPVTFSLTDGTDIPPPPDSPIEEEAPAFAPTQASTATANGAGPANGAYDGRGRTSTTVEAAPLSPASTTRPSSIRRFLSRKSLNANYTNGANGSQDDLTGGGRPDSPSSFMSGRPSLGKKKSGSWFGKLGGKRSSVVYEDAPVEKKAKGPPPPKLPELNQLKAKVGNNEEGSLGGEDMFKNIRG